MPFSDSLASRTAFELLAAIFAASARAAREQHARGTTDSTPPRR